MRNCPSCDASPGELHQECCTVERCCLCGNQAMACPCVYEVNGIATATLEHTHPDVFERGPTDEMISVLEAKEEEFGGRLRWTGEWPTDEACREFNLWAYAVGAGFITCTEDHPRAQPDANRLPLIAHWDKRQRRWVRNDAN